MKIKREPSLADVTGLLESVGLPNSDLNDDSMQHFFGIDNAGILIATIGIQLIPPYGLLRSLVVNPDFRRHRLGLELVEKLESYALTKKVKQLFLLTNDADLYFAKLGFEIIERELTPEVIKQSEQFSSLCPGSAIVMTKHLV